MKESGATADRVGHAILVSACQRGTAWPVALTTLKRHGQSDDLDAKLCTSVASAFEKGGLWSDALALLETLQVARAAADTAMTNSATTACDRASQWTAAFRCVDHLQSQALQPDLLTYNPLVSACQTATMWELACRTVAAVRASGLKPTAVTCESCVAASVIGGQAITISPLLEELAWLYLDILSPGGHALPSAEGLAVVPAATDDGTAREVINKDSGGFLASGTPVPGTILRDPEAMRSAESSSDALLADLVDLAEEIADWPEDDGLTPEDSQDAGLEELAQEISGWYDDEEFAAADTAA
eukprot:TRINITY_DN41265_c0_g1_i3.p1 TRINITY_DN41265_c0_g1~~TRINITY_DN41265_c0_g1_i3.p1  ORF type:complete len:301 (-),score=47.72 TRINITY_DN41265_c0_g1_i3:729-1631(-)